MFDGFFLSADGNVSFVPGNSSFPFDMSLRKVCAERAKPEVYVGGCLAINRVHAFVVITFKSIL